jgi:hypothetical protein
MANTLGPGDVQRQRFRLAHIKAKLLVCVLRTFHPIEARNIGKNGCLCRCKCFGPHDANVAFRTFKMRSSLRLNKPRIRSGFSCHEFVSRVFG